MAEVIQELCGRHEAISDFHLHQDAALAYRDPLGEMREFADCVLTGTDLAALLMQDTSQLTELLEAKGGHLDSTVRVGAMRFRVNAYLHGGNRSLGLSLRRLRSTIPTYEALRLPKSLAAWCERRTGLLLVTGPSGSGKTSTLAAMVNHLNATRRSHMILIEDPIEYVHSRGASVITQREVGCDSESFAASLRMALRQNPDLIVVGEVRDRDTMETVLHAAETGHLVLATLHSTSASRAPERVVDYFANEGRSLAQAQLAASLIGVIAQVLVPKSDRSGRVLACECLANTKEASTHIREGRFQALDNVMAQSAASENMWLLNAYLAQLVFSGEVLAESALTAAYDRADMATRLGAEAHEARQWQ